MLGTRGFPLERAAAQVCREASGRVPVDRFARDLDLAAFNSISAASSPPWTVSLCGTEPNSQKTPLWCFLFMMMARRVGQQPVPNQLWPEFGQTDFGTTLAKPTGQSDVERLCPPPTLDFLWLCPDVRGSFVGVLVFGLWCVCFPSGPHTFAALPTRTVLHQTIPTAPRGPPCLGPLPVTAPNPHPGTPKLPGSNSTINEQEKSKQLFF